MAVDNETINTCAHPVTTFAEEKITHHLLQDITDQRVPVHPFHDLQLSPSQFRLLLQEYLAMSVAFPYLQAGASGPVIMQKIANNLPMDYEVELTSVVGAFLVWDELGGWFNTAMRGARGLPNILETKHFHANILQSDLKFLFGEDVQPNYGSTTRTYLLDLYQRLSNFDHIVRCATMASFELHAERMITELWGSVHTAFAVPKNKLRYFASHVGGSDPAEAYHVKMTENLIEHIVYRDRERFIEKYLNAYELHSNWCQALVAQNTPVH